VMTCAPFFSNGTAVRKLVNCHPTFAQLVAHPSHGPSAIALEVDKLHFGTTALPLN
jgi:hypothetical protein